MNYIILRKKKDTHFITCTIRGSKVFDGGTVMQKYIQLRSILQSLDTEHIGSQNAIYTIHGMA